MGIYTKLYITGCSLQYINSIYTVMLACIVPITFPNKESIVRFVDLYSIPLLFYVILLDCFTVCDFAAVFKVLVPLSVSFTAWPGRDTGRGS